MAKTYGQKLKPLYVLDILKKESDEEHPLTAADICAALERQGIAAERKSVYSDISALEEYGVDIVKSASPRGWFIASREFEEPEIYMLADAVRTAKFISAAKTRAFVKKLDSFVSGKSAEKREKQIHFSSAGKCSNEEIFYSIDKISRAIESKISPYSLVWQDDNYYVIGNYEKYDNLIHLRLDRMYSVEITDDAARHFSQVSEYQEYFDVSDYTAKLFSMHGGSVEKIELRCSKKIMEQVADRFGENIFIKKVTDTDFCFSADAAISDALVTWIINYGENIKVLSPQKLCESVIKRANVVLKIYK